jgi:hypothetical protein
VSPTHIHKINNYDSTPCQLDTQTHHFKLNITAKSPKKLMSISKRKMHSVHFHGSPRS